MEAGPASGAGGAPGDPVQAPGCRPHHQVPEHAAVVGPAADEPGGESERSADHGAERAQKGDRDVERPAASLALRTLRCEASPDPAADEPEDREPHNRQGEGRSDLTPSTARRKAAQCNAEKAGQPLGGNDQRSEEDAVLEDPTNRRAASSETPDITRAPGHRHDRSGMTSTIGTGIRLNIRILLETIA